MKKYCALLVAGMGLWVAGCNKNPGWEGKGEPENKAAKLAQEACACIYEVMDAEADYDVDAILGDMEAFKKHQASGGLGSIEEKFPDIAKAMLSMELSDKIDGSPCMAEVDDKSLGQGVSIEEIERELQKSCTLAMFYY